MKLSRPHYEALQAIAEGKAVVTSSKDGRGTNGLHMVPGNAPVTRKTIEALLTEKLIERGPDMEYRITDAGRSGLRGMTFIRNQNPSQ